MNAQLVLIAQKFCADHFCDNNLEQENYMSIVDTYLERFEDPKEKIVFLKEVIRIGNTYLSDAHRQLNKMEERDLSKSQFGSL